MKIFERLNRIEDPVKRRAYLVGLLTEEFKKRKRGEPIVVGGLALEIYTQGSYTTGDIDIKADKEALEEILHQWGFVKRGRVWFNESLDIYVDWLGSELEEGPEAEKRINTVILDDGLEIRVISIEDLIIDRLNSAKWWGDEDGLLWTRVLIKVKEATGESLDVKYLKKRAKEEEIEDYLLKLLEE